MATNTSQVFEARAVGWIIDFFESGNIPEFFEKGSKEQTFIYIFTILCAFMLMKAAARYGWRITLGRSTHRAANMLRQKIWDSVRFFSQKDLDTDFTKGVIMNASNSDVNTARFIFGFTLIGLFDVIFLGLLTLGTMFTIHKTLTVCTVILFGVLPYFVKKQADKEMEQFSRSQEELSEFDDLMTQAISSIRLSRVTQTDSFWKFKLNSQANKYRNKRLKATYTWLDFYPLMGAGTLGTYLILFTLGLYYLFQGQMSVGDFVSMQGLIFVLQDPLMEIGFVISEFRKSQTCLERLSDIYDVKPSKIYQSEENKVEPNETVFEVKDLNFSYDDGSSVLNNFNLVLNRGEHLGITGSIGAGKTTLVKILSGIERNIDGDVKFYGQKFNHYDHFELRKSIGHVSQRPFLFASSIRENIAMDREMSDGEVMHYLEVAGLGEDIRKLEDGLDTELGEWGINLSGGQKQRMTLARCLSRKPDVLFLDDCLSAVDTVTEERILQNLKEELKDKTLIWVAHRKSTLKYCQKIIEL